MGVFLGQLVFPTSWCGSVFNHSRGPLVDWSKAQHAYERHKENQGLSDSGEVSGLDIPVECGSYVSPCENEQIESSQVSHCHGQ